MGRYHKIQLVYVYLNVLLFFIFKSYLFNRLCIHCVSVEEFFIQCSVCLFVVACEATHARLVSRELSCVRGSEVVCLSKLHKLRLCSLCHL